MIIHIIIAGLVAAIDSGYKIPRCNSITRKQNLQVTPLVEKLVDLFLLNDDNTDFSISDFSFVDKEIKSFC